MVEFRLTDDEMDRLTRVSDIDGDYPYDSMIEDSQAGR